MKAVSVPIVEVVTQRLHVSVKTHTNKVLLQGTLQAESVLLCDNCTSTNRILERNLDCDSVVEYLLGMCKAEGLY